MDLGPDAHNMYRYMGVLAGLRMVLLAYCVKRLALWYAFACKDYLNGPYASLTDFNAACKISAGYLIERTSSIIDLPTLCR